MNEEQQLAISAVSRNHAHQIIFQPPQPPQMNQFGQQIAPAQQGGWQIIPSEDGHTHQFAEYEAESPIKKSKDEELISEIRGLRDEAIDTESKSREAAKEAYEFYCGDQWTHSQKSQLTEEGRACLTINKIEKNIDILLGFQRQQRTDFRFFPVEQTDQSVSDILNILVKVILESCTFPLAESEVFRDMTIAGRGIFNAYMDFQQNIQGDIKIERFPWDGVYFGPHEKIDASDCEYIIKTRNYSLGKIKQLWPEKADKVSEIDATSDIDRNTESHTQHSSAQYVKSDNFKDISTTGQPTTSEIQKKSYEVIECQQKQTFPKVVLVKTDEEFIFDAWGWKEKDIEQVLTIQGFVKIPQLVTKIRITRICGSVVLSDENPAEVPYDDFTAVVAYAKKAGNKFWGKVKALIDPQKEKNKRHSQAIDIGNKMAVYGWMYDEATFPQDQDRLFEKVANRPGFKLKINDINRPPVRFEGTKFPSEIVELMALNDKEIENLVNIVPQEAGANTSGVALHQYQQTRLMGNEFIFDNFAMAKKKLGKLIVGLIQKYYTPQRIYRIISGQPQQATQMIGGQPLEQYSEAEIVKLLETADLTQYDVAISESSYSPTARLTTFILLKELAQAGQPIPPEVLINLMDIPESEKQKILGAIQMQQQAAAAENANAQKSEINKTLIAKGIIPPEVQQQLQGATQIPPEMAKQGGTGIEQSPQALPQ